jgi:hypothetical protein
MSSLNNSIPPMMNITNNEQSGSNSTLAMNDAGN